MDTLQADVYKYHLDCIYVDKNGDEAIGARLQALRMAAADPSSLHLKDQPGHCVKPCRCTLKTVPPEQQLQRLEQQRKDLVETFGVGDPEEINEHQRQLTAIEAEIKTPVQRYDTIPAKSNCPRCQGRGTLPLPARSGQAFIPKHASVLNLVQEILARGEQVVIGSAFNDPLDHLSRWLDEAGVRHLKLDGRTSPKQRGQLAATFKRGRYRPAAGDGAASCPVLLAGVECMAEGHSFHLANNVILIAYSWAYDKFKQALDRVHRMPSTKPVNVYVVLCAGTIDRKLESLIQDKGDAAELVLDGRLIGERTEEINLAELLKIAHKEFDAGSNTIDEALLQAQWLGGPSGIGLRDKLRAAMAAWDLHPVECGTIPQGKPAQLGIPDLPVSQTLHRFLFQERGANDWKIMPGFTAPAGQAAEQIAAWNKSDRHGRQWKSEPITTQTHHPKENTTMNGRRNTLPRIQPI